MEKSIEDNPIPRDDSTYIQSLQSNLARLERFLDDVDHGDIADPVTQHAHSAEDGVYVWRAQSHLARETVKACRELIKRHNELLIRHAKSRVKLSQARTKVTKYKKIAHDWNDFIAQRGLAQPTTAMWPAGQSTTESHVRDTAKSEQSENVSAGGAVDAPFSEPGVGSAEQSNNIAVVAQGSPDMSRQMSSVAARSSSPRETDHGITSSQTTVDDRRSQDDGLARVKDEPMSDDEPIVVLARPTKRKRESTERAVDANPRIKSEVSSSQLLHEITSEHTNASMGSLSQSDRRMNFDLDVMEPAIQTPRKPRGPHQESDMTRFGRSTRPDKASPMHTEFQADAESRQSLDEPPGSGASDTHALDGQDEETTRILRPISANIPRKAIHKSTRSKDLDRTPRIRRTGMADRIGMLAEDADSTSKRPEPKLEASKSQYERLDRYLEHGSEHQQSRTPLTVSKTTTAASHQPQVRATKPLQQPHPHSHNMQTPTRPEVASKNNASPTTTKRLKVHKDLRGSEHSHGDHGSTPQPEDEPLRIRPVTSLHLEDFKVNPNYLGSDFAFADTLRGRDQRRDLHTCTKPECCGGAFRKALEVGGTVLSGKSDALALEAYLGDTWADVIRAYSPEKRKELTLQAHVHAFAEKNGKHRHAFERPSSPPGFWRTDMPDTQEASADRAQARDMENRVIEERWREALKSNGRWLFRDE